MTAALVVARTVRGVEDVVAAEVRRLGLGRVERIGHREVWFRCADPGPDVLALRAADDVFLVAGEAGGVGRSKASLRVVSEAAAAVDVRLLVGLRERFGGSHGFGRGGVDVSASFLGRRNYTRYDVEDAVGVPLATALGVPYFGRRSGRIPPPGGVSWRVTITDDRALLALRIADRPLHRRAYRVASRPGSLHPPLAAAMVALASPRPGTSLLDPFCGTGTIPIEAAAVAGSGVVHNLRIVAGDRDGVALASAVINAEHAATTAYLAATRSGDHDEKMYGNTVLVPRLKTSGTPRPTPDPQPDSTTTRPDPTTGPDPAAHPDRTTRQHPAAHRITWTTADAAHLPIADHTIDLVVTNPPWSRQVPPTGTLADEPHRLWQELRRVLRPDGRALLLLPDVDGHAADARRAGLVVTRRWPVSLSGMHPEVVELAPRG